MNLLNHSISIIFILIFTSVALLLLFSFTKRFLPILSVRVASKTKVLKRWLYITEAFFVVVGLLVFISFSMENNIALSIILMLFLISILFFFSQFYLKNYIAGLLFKSSNEYKIGDQITIKDKTGRIEYFTNTQLKIKNPEGDNILIPYSILINESKSLRKVQEKVNTCTFNLELSSNKDFEILVNSLKQYIRLLPWVHPSFDADIEVIDKDNSHIHVTITVYTFDKKYYSKIEQSVREFHQKLEQ